jgi:uncharacterized protein YfdQ (DUF2303 family)
MSEDIKNDIQAAIDAGLRLAKIQTFGVGNSVLAAVTPEGASIETADLEKFLPVPRRAVRDVKVETAESFARYFNRFANPDSVVALETDAGAMTGTFTGVIDYHQPDTPQWCGHRVFYTPRVTPEWKLWRDADKEKFSQQEFAEFIEANFPDVIEPVAADLLEIAKTLEARRDVNFKSGLRLDNGDHQIRWEEKTEAKAGVNGELDIPGVFVLMFPLFQGGNPATLTARLKYRLESGRVTFWYELVRPHKEVMAQFETLKQVIINFIGEHEFIEGKL